jgi:Clr5 domain
MDSNAPHSDLSDQVWPFASLASSLPLDVAQEDSRPTVRAGMDRAGETSARRKMFPKEKWMALKPVIKRLYFDEGQTFVKVAEYLHEHHDFNPT